MEAPSATANFDARLVRARAFSCEGLDIRLGDPAGMDSQSQAMLSRLNAQAEREARLSKKVAIATVIQAIRQHKRAFFTTYARSGFIRAAAERFVEMGMSANGEYRQLRYATVGRLAVGIASQVFDQGCG